MNDNTIYITGLHEFKPALINQLGSEWIHGAHDIGSDTIRFTFAENSTLENLKAAIGAEIVSTYDIRFSQELPLGHLLSIIIMLTKTLVRLPNARNGLRFEED